MKKGQYNSVKKRSNSKTRSERKSSALRREAERLFSERNAPVLPQDALKLVHELIVHQAELELQNQELRQAQDELIASREKYANFFDFSPVAYFTLDHMGLISEVNLTGASLLGVDRTRLKGKPFALFVAAPSRDTFDIHHQRILRAGAARSCELLLTREDGTSLYALTQSVPVWDREGNCTGVRSVVTDITQLKKAEETRALLAEVQKEKERLSALVKSIQDQVWFVDTRKRFILANPSAFPEFGPEYRNGVDVKTLAQRLEVCHPDGSPCPIDETPPLRALRGEVVRAQEEMLRSPRTAKTTFIQVSSAPVRDQGGVIVGSVSVVRDITDRKRNEEYLKERLRFETLLSQLSARFVNVPPLKVDLEINKALGVVCQHLGLDIAALWQWSTADSNCLTITHLYRPLGGPPAPERFDAAAMFPWCLRELTAGRIVAVSTEEVPAEAARDQESWRHYGIKSSLTFPLSAGRGPLIGALGFNTVRKKHSWPEHLVKWLQLVAEVFANALARKNSAHALRESKERLELASTSAGVGLWILEVSTGKFWATEKALELFGLPSDYILSLEAFLNLVDPADRQRVLEAVYRALRSDDEMRIEYRIVVNNGVRWVGSRGRRQLSSAGEVERLTGVSTDITHRKLYEAELEERLRFEKLLADTSAKLAKVTGDRVDQEIKEALHSLVEFMHADRCALISAPHDRQAWQIAYEAHLDGFSALPTNTDLPTLLFPYAARKLSEKPESWGFASLADLPTEAHTDRKTYREWGIPSMVHVLVEVGSSIDYFMCMAGAPKEVLSAGAYVARLRLIGEIFVNAIERKRAEKELREREAMLRSITSSSPVGISFTSSDRVIQWANEAMLQIVGYNLNELRGLPARMLYETEEEFLRVGDIVYDSPDGCSSLNTTLRRKDGQVRNVQVRAAWVDPHNAAKGVVQVVEDVTERLQAQAAKEEAWSTTSAILESTEDMIWTVDAQRFGLLTFNSALRQYFLGGPALILEVGMNPDDMVVGGSFTPEFARTWNQFYRKALHEGPFTEEYVVSSGAKALLLSFNLLERDGKVFGISVFGKDVTERKRMEEEIRAAGEEWQSTFDAVPDLIVILDKECRTIRANKAALSLFSRRDNEIRDSYCYMGTHRTECCSAECPVKVALKTKRHEEVELYDEAKQTWFNFWADPILDDRGEIKRIIYRARDISDRKKADVEAYGVRREMLRLERLLLMGELSASLAHELNQPLTSILSNARAAARFLEVGKLATEELKMILEDIVRDDKRAGDIIRSLRSMLRTEEGEMEIIEISGLLNEAVTLFNSEAILRNIAVEKDIPPSLPRVRANRVLIQQIVMNLMMNAAEAMEKQPAPKRRMTIRAAAVNANSHVRVAIRDLGKGIDAADAGRLFEPFYTTKTSGLGMGLALSRSIAEAHGGHIWAENEKRGGAIFFFDLPVYQGQR